MLRIACYDEYRANAYYQKVIDTYGPVPPFVNVAQAEVRHFSAIELLCQRYGVTPPVNDWYAKTVVASTLQGCCADCVEAEIANIEMYDHLLKFVTEADIRDVFFREQAASYNNHLPVFSRCAAQAAPSNTQDEIYKLAQDMAAGNVTTAQLTSTLGNLLSRDLLIGAAIGAAAVYVLGNTLSEAAAPADTNETKEK